jgi:hypothetical protein
MIQQWHLKQWLAACADEARLEGATVVAVFVLFGALIGWTAFVVPAIIWDRVARRSGPHSEVGPDGVRG